MSKTKGFLKAIFGTESLLEIGRKVIAITIILIGAIPTTSSIVTRNIRDIVQDETAPINNYIYDDIEKLIIKNAGKVEKNPSDLHIEDIESCLNYWPMLKNANRINSAVVEQKVEILKEWYRLNCNKV